MNNSRVVITPTTIPTNPADIALCEAELAQARDTGSIPDIEAAQDALVYAQNQTAIIYTATIDGPFEVDTFAVENVEGRAILTLQFEVGSLAIGDPSTGEPAPALRDEVPPAERVWGAPAPDPREKIAGWSPERADGLRTYGDPAVTA